MPKDKKMVNDHIAKLIEDTYHPPTPASGIEPGDRVANRPTKAVKYQTALSIATTIYRDIMEVSFVKQFLPEIEIISQIISSNVLSPQDLLTVTTNIRNDSKEIPEAIKAFLNPLIKNKIVDFYKIDTLSEKAIEECLFVSGSLPVLIMPPSVIRRITNNDFSAEESKNFDTGVFNNTGTASSGDVDKEFIDSLIEFQSDYRVALKNAINAEETSSARKTSFLSTLSPESKSDDKNKSYEKMLELMRSKKERQHSPNTSLRTPSKKVTLEETEAPLMEELPAESVIPITSLGRKNKCLGYIILYANGVPLNPSKDVRSYIRSISSSSRFDATYSDNVARLGRSLNSSFDSEDYALEDLQNSHAIYLEDHINKQIKNGILGEDAEVVFSDSIKLALFNRALASSRTTMVFVPTELLTYYAFNTNDFGVGTSLVASSSVIAGMRASLMYADTMRAISNTIGTTNLKFDLDPNIPDPKAYVMEGVAAYQSLNRLDVPTTGNVFDIIDSGKAASIRVTATGHPNFPSTELDISHSNPQNQITEEDTHDRLKKQHILYFGITPEQIDTSVSIERKDQITTNNIMFYKRTRRIARRLEELNTDLVRKLCIYNGPLINELTQSLKENMNKPTINKAINELDIEKSDDIDSIIALIYEYINTLEFELQNPDGTTEDALSEGFDELSDNIDKILENCLSDMIFDDDSSGQLSEHLDKYKAAIKSSHLIMYCKNTGFMKDLVDSFDINEKGELDEDYKETLVRELHGANEMMLAIAKAVEEARESIESKINKEHVFEEEKDDSLDSSDGADDSLDNQDGTSDEEVEDVPEEDDGSTEEDDQSSDNVDEAEGDGNDDLDIDIPKDLK